MNKNEDMNGMELQGFDSIMNEQKQLKNQGDSYLLNKEFVKAEEIYNKILTNIGNLPNVTGEIDISQEQTNTMLSLLKGVYGNLSLAQAKQFKLTEAINTTTYILTKLDPYYDIYIDWTPNNKNKSLFNLNDLENPIHFIQKGKINKRTLHWTGNTIYLDPKTYDGTTKVYTHGGDRHE